MEFVIKGMKYNTEKMEKVAEVKKWYLINEKSNPPAMLGRIV